jgi:hypothetical protein
MSIVRPEFVATLAAMLDDHAEFQRDMLGILKEAVLALGPEDAAKFAAVGIDRYQAMADFHTEFVIFLRAVQEGAIGSA